MQETLEEEFKRVCAEVGPKIKEALKRAGEALNEAEKLSTESGIPFISGISAVGQSFGPTSAAKWRSIQDENLIESVLAEATGAYRLGEGYGWEHSAVC